MSRTITIEPVTRIEGHAKVVVRIGDDGEVEQARLHVNEFRGFEKFCEGRLFYEMPLITERICGICPVSHHLGSAKACDQIVGVDIPRPAKLLRELMHMGQTLQSHAMHFFELAGPDLLLGFDADPAIRNVAGLAAANPELALKAIALRKFGQEIIARVGDRRIHPNFAVPGGVNKALLPADREWMLAQLPEMIEHLQTGVVIIKAWAQANQAEMDSFASFATGYMGMVGADDALELYDGEMNLVDAQRQPVERFDGRTYLDQIAEHVEPWSYLKFPYFKRLGWPGGVYRVGPLGRLNAAKKMATPLAQSEYEIFHQMCGGQVIQGSLYFHYARLIEALYAAERVRQLLEDSDILSKDIRISAKVTNSEGVGVIEAPRGTLWHHYTVDEDGLLQKVNLIVATGNNNYAMSRAVEEVAKRYIHGDNVAEGMLNRVEAAIRAYDPCLSCSTHAVGKMPLQLMIVNGTGEEIRRISR
jgi:NAD-reducing hydrogenase large subunit